MSCVPNNLVLETSNEERHVIAVFISRSLESFSISWKRSPDIALQIKVINYYQMFPWQNAVF